MPEGDNFVDQAKAMLLFEHQQGNNIGAMLEQSPTNSDVNELMARVCTVVDLSLIHI